MAKWAAHRRLLPPPPAAHGGRAGGAGESVSPLFDSNALPAVFEKLLLLATRTVKTAPRNRLVAVDAEGGSFGPLGDRRQHQYPQQRGWAGDEGEMRYGDHGGGGGGDDELLEEARAGLDELLRWALPSLVSGFGVRHGVARVVGSFKWRLFALSGQLFKPV